jgi:hypothetical protein
MRVRVRPLYVYWAIITVLFIFATVVDIVMFNGPEHLLPDILLSFATLPASLSVPIWGPLLDKVSGDYIEFVGNAVVFGLGWAQGWFVSMCWRRIRSI